MGHPAGTAAPPIGGCAAAEIGLAYKAMSGADGKTSARAVFGRSNGVRLAGLVLTAAVLLGAGWLAITFLGGPAVEVARIPEGGRMPRAVIDPAGAVHVIYFEGVMSGGDLLHVSRAAGDPAWTAPVRVNSERRSAVGMGPMDGGQVALDGDGRLHAAWFQTNPTRIFYTRSDPGGAAFEPQRTLWQEEDGSFEASPTLAAGDGGGVYVFWHAGGREDADRAVHMTASQDGGDTFGPVRRVSQAGEGACGCCGLAALAGGSGAVHVSYRSARANIRRDQRLLVSGDAGRTFEDRPIDEWEIGACPVTTTTLSAAPGAPGAPRVAWETDGRVYYAPVDRLGAPIEPEGSARFRRKNPVVAVNSRGDTLLAWGDAPGLRAGGTLHWRLFDAGGRPIGEQGDGTTVPSGSAPTAIVKPDDSFLLLF